MATFFMRYPLLIAFAVLLMLGARSPLAAQEGEVFCAAVLACDSDGQVSLPYRNGPCAEYYARQCASELANSVAQQLAACEDQHSQLQTKVKKLERKNRRLSRKLEALGGSR